MMRERVDWIIALGMTSFASTVLLARVPAFPLLGYDSYPEILTSRILSFSDFIGTFTEQTSEGFYPSAFLRPLLNLSLAADYALWGIEPWGYHLTTVILVGACGLALFWLSKCLLGPDARWGPLAALTVFLVAPVQLEIIPLISRRMDVLCGLFSALALATQIDRIRRPKPIVGITPAILTALAVGSKESGVALAPVILLLVVDFLPERRLLERLRFAIRVVLPHAIAIAGVFSLRYAAIGGLGGHETTDPTAILSRLPRWLGNIMVQILSFGPSGPNGFSIQELSLISAFMLSALVLLSFFLLRRQQAAASRDRESHRELTCFCIAGVWIVMLAGIYAVTGLLQPWYLFLPIMGLSLALGSAVQRCVRISRESSGGRRAIAIASLAMITIWAGLVARYSPLVIGFGHWNHGAAQVGPYLQALTVRIELNSDGRYIEVAPPPLVGPGSPSPIVTPFATWIAIYSLPAWAQLQFPDREIEFQMLSDHEPPPAPDANVLRIGVRSAK